MSAGILALWMDVNPLQEDECTEWYIREHVPDRIAVPTFVQARRFKSTLGAGYFAAYEATSVEGLCDPSYMALLDNISPWGLKMRAAFSQTARATLRVTSRVRSGEGGFVATVRFQGGEPETGAWIGRALVPKLAETRGIVAVSYWQSEPHIRQLMDERRITGRFDAAVDQVLLIEGVRQEAVAASIGEQSLDDLLGARKIGCIVVDHYRFQFGVSKLADREA
jgi:hypothetical protein